MTRIIMVADDIFQFAPEHCDTAAFWLGGHPGHSWNEFLERCQQYQCLFHRYDGNGNWQGVGGIDCDGKLHQLTPCLGTLRCVCACRSRRFNRGRPRSHSRHDSRNTAPM